MGLTRLLRERQEGSFCCRVSPEGKLYLSAKLSPTKVLRQLFAFSRSESSRISFFVDAKTNLHAVGGRSVRIATHGPWSGPVRTRAEHLRKDARPIAQGNVSSERMAPSLLLSC